MFQLVTRNGETVEFLPRSVLQIGRGDPCDVRLDDRLILRVQCRLELRGGQLILTD
ncbi:MAG: FHA domain-containing protein [Planctomycetaceae bacterium]|nr:FHA domain-containing protein [Planctomycetaceae bacterium]